MSDPSDFADRIARSGIIDTGKKSGTGSLIDYAGEFFKSAISSAGPELIGLPPFEGVRQFRRDNPVGGIVSSIGGVSVPYVGWGVMARRIGKLEDFVGKIGSMERAPLLTGAAREMARFAPFEAGRLAGAGVFGGDLGDVGFGAAVDLGIAGVAGAVVGGLKAAGPQLEDISRLVPGVDTNAPLTLQLRQIREGMAGLEGDALLEVQRRAKTLERFIRAEQAERGYVAPLEGGADTAWLENLFQLRRTRGHNSRMLLQATGGFDDAKEYKALLERAGVPDDADAFWQYPRAIQITSTRAGQNVQRAVQANMEKVDEGWWLRKEAEDGLFVVARKVDGELTKGKKGDSWLLFKTDEPGKFLGRREAWANAMVKRSAWEPGPPRAIGAEIWDETAKLQETLPFRDYRHFVGPEGRVKNFAEGVVKTMGLDKIKGTSVEFMGRRLYNFAKEYFTPSAFQFGRSPRAKWLYGMMRASFDKAAARTTAMLEGEHKLSGGESLVYDIFTGTKATGYKGGPAIRQLVEDLSDSELFDLWRAWIGRWDEKTIKQQIVEGEFSEKAGLAWKRLQELDAEFIGQLQATQKAAGQAVSKAMPDHLMISRTWVGDWRVPIEDVRGNIVAVASGRNRAAALKEADFLVEQAEAEGKNWRYRDAYISDRTSDFDLARSMRPSASDLSVSSALRERWIKESYPPQFLKERQGMGGFVGYKAPWDKKELIDILRSHLIQGNKYQAELTFKTLFESDLNKLAVENPHVYQMLEARLRDLQGQPGPASQWQNAVVDKVLGPVLGKNSATKVVRAMNTFQMNWQLGMGNLMFPVLNAMTFMQTTLPQIAFVMGAAPARVAKHYSVYAAAGPDGLPRGAMSVLDPLKLGYAAIRQLRNPSAEFRSAFERAATDGVWDPRFVEEYVGEKAKISTRLREAVSGPEGFFEFGKAVSEFLPAQSEKFARAHSFAVGHLLAKDFLNIADPDSAYRFAKEFTEKTMFLYSTVDRARVMTGPVGSLFGMFKNWQMHYLGWMMEYAGAGIMEGTWKPLLWGIGGTGLIGGVGALPFYGVADAFSRFATNESLMKNIYDMFGPGERGLEFSVADTVFYGLPAFFNVSLQGSAAAPFADPARDASLLFSFVHWDRMKAIGRLVGTSIDHWSATGRHPVDSQLVRDQLIRAFLPRSMFRTVQALQGEYLNSLTTGNPILQDFTPGERMLYAAGFNPRYVERTYAVADELWKNQTKMKAKIQTFGRALAQAQETRQWREMGELLKDAVAQGLPLDSVLRSAQGHISKDRADMISRQFDPMEVWRMQGVIGR